MHPYDWELYGDIGTGENCKRCLVDRQEERPAVDDDGLCGHCHWAILAEIEEGFADIRDFLRATPLVKAAEVFRMRGVMGL